MKAIKQCVVLATFGFSLGLGASVGESSVEAAAFYERATGAVCQPTSPSVNYQWYSASTYVGAEAQNTASGIHTFVCAVPDKTDLPASAITSIEVYVHDANDTSSASGNQVAVKVCAQGTMGGTVTCGTASASTGVGYKTLTLSGSQLSLLSSYSPYLLVTLPASDWSTTSPGTQAQGSSGIAGLYFYKSS